METMTSIKPLLAVMASLVAVPMIVSSRTANVREAWTFVAAIIKFLIVLSMLPTILGGTELVYTLLDVVPGLAIKLRVDALGILFALVSSSLWIITSAYSVGYMRGLHEHSQTRYFAFFALALSATVGVAFAANLLTLYLFYEMLSFVTYPLVTHHQDPEARASGRKYLLYIVGTSIAFVFPAMLYLYVRTGTLAFVPGGFLADIGTDPIALLVLLLFVFGFAKVGIMPFHAWLPAAMVAPTPVSALLHAVAVVKVGAFCILRVITGVFGQELLSALHLDQVLCYVASFTIITASIIALYQDGLKRRLAFSTIGQLSYIVLGAALLSPKGLIGGSIHIAMHAFGKITLFFCAGAIFVATGKQHISEMAGIGRRMPYTMTAFFIGALSVIGLPPTGGFLSKWYLVLGTLQADQIVMLVVLLTSSLLNAAYFLPIVYHAFFSPSKEPEWSNGTIREAPTWCLIPPVVTAICSIILFFYAKPFLALARLAVGG